MKELYSTQCCLPKTLSVLYTTALFEEWGMDNRANRPSSMLQHNVNKIIPFTLALKK